VVAKEMTPHGKRSGQIPEILDGFGKAMKAGVATDYENKDKLLPLLLLESSKSRNRTHEA
jgi:HSP90 family molecular chaperone